MIDLIFLRILYKVAHETPVLSGSVQKTRFIT